MSNLLKKLVDGPQEKLKILTTATHEGYQSNLAKTGHEFYLLSENGFKSWDFHTRPLPPNTYLCPANHSQLDRLIGFDLVLCQNKISEFQPLSQIAHSNGIPLIVLDHTEPFPNLTKLQLEILTQYRGDINVFITDHNKNTWRGSDEDVVIPHGIDTNLFSGWNGTELSGLSVVNLFPQRDVFCGWNLWQEISKEVPVKLVGFNPGLSESINDVQLLSQTYASHRFFLNTSQLSPVPLSMLEAMSCGCPVVTTNKQQISKLIKHGYNGLMSNDPKELISFCRQLMDDEKLAKSIGEAGRETILKEHSMDIFISRWNNVFDKAYNLALNRWRTA